MDEEEYKAELNAIRALSSRVRLKLLRQITKQTTVSAPDIASQGDFEITAESIVNNLNKLEQAGFLTSREVRGPGNRPRKEFSLSGEGRSLVIEAKAEEFRCDFNEIQEKEGLDDA